VAIIKAIAILCGKLSPVSVDVAGEIDLCVLQKNSS
jgi:hypothetical protein